MRMVVGCIWAPSDCFRHAPDSRHIPKPPCHPTCLSGFKCSRATWKWGTQNLKDVPSLLAGSTLDITTAPASSLAWVSYHQVRIRIYSKTTGFESYDSKNQVVSSKLYPVMSLAELTRWRRRERISMENLKLFIILHVSFNYFHGKVMENHHSPNGFLVAPGTKHQGPRASATILAPAAAGVLCGPPGVMVGLAVGTTAYGAQHIFLGIVGWNHLSL